MNRMPQRDWETERFVCIAYPRMQMGFTTGTCFFFLFSGSLGFYVTPKLFYFTKQNLPRYMFELGKGPQNLSELGC